ncbi:TIGR03767 family metallophosphoesterase [Spongisporangium articulatum]|uniref:TIGR03767 family metallophosphoesterase n=1 Tax=Spongisporangium articulatum TaxID=3362603 RepID=A0ABW8AL47_9ACTN
MTEISRRGFLAGLGALGVGSGVLGTGVGPFGVPSAYAAPPVGTGTTLEAAAVPLGTSGYRRLGAGPGWPTVVRTELATAHAGREARRTALTSFVQLTDVHVVDAQSPARFEYVHPLVGAAFRPHETLTTQGLVSLIRRVNGLAAGPHTGRDFDAVVTTGDNTDNKEHAELEWFLTAMNGGTLTPNTGARGRFEGVQNSGNTLYWNPESPVQDRYKAKGFPQIPGLLGAAIRPVTSPGLQTPWYCVFGNHDDSVSGTLPSGIPPVEALYTGAVKLEAPNSEAYVRAVARALTTDPRSIAAVLASFSGPVRLVTPDPKRKPFTPKQFMQAHLEPGHTGPGPVGHGFTKDAADDGIAYYTFELAPGVVGISMDSTNRAGFTDGSLGAAQFRWIEKTLTAGSSRYYDSSGHLVTSTREDTWFVLFSHHTSDTMGNVLPDPARALEKRYTGKQLVALLNRFPNVLAWVNGHTHVNAVTPHPGPTPEQGFWEVNTASHVDFPQLGRVIEVADNRDGTVSLLATLFEADSPYAADHADFSPAGLAALYRELSFNDLHYEADRVGTPADRNVELLVPGRP